MKKAAKKRVVAGAKDRTERAIDARFAPVVLAFARLRDVKAGKVFSSYGLKVNGKIFAMLGRGKLVVKLPKERVDAMVSAGRGERFDPGHGRLMKEWIGLASGESDWVELAREAYEFVGKAKS